MFWTEQVNAHPESDKIKPFLHFLWKLHQFLMGPVFPKPHFTSFLLANPHQMWPIHALHLPPLPVMNKGPPEEASHRYCGLMLLDGRDWRGCGWRSRHSGPLMGHIWIWPVLDTVVGARALGQQPWHQDPPAPCGSSVQRMHQCSQLPPSSFQLILHVVKYHHGSSLLAGVWAGWAVDIVFWRGLQQAGRCLWSGLVEAGAWRHTSRRASPPGEVWFVLVILFPRGGGVLIIRVLALLWVPGVTLGVGQGRPAPGVPVGAVGSAQADGAPHRPVPTPPPVAVGRVYQQQPARGSCGDDFGGDSMAGGLLLRRHLHPVQHLPFQREVVLQKSKRQLVRTCETRPGGMEQTMHSTRHLKGCSLPISAPISLSIRAGCRIGQCQPHLCRESLNRYLKKVLSMKSWLLWVASTVLWKSILCLEVFVSLWLWKAGVCRHPNFRQLQRGTTSSHRLLPEWWQSLFVTLISSAWQSHFRGSEATKRRDATSGRSRTSHGII